ncbi:hypothetical protein F0562_034185 [Nyssa sinensis]|uniref:Uncharacterized protein n=1 Tax=Nyssa sinensis TaxID=561372 RepID=A0A5J5AF65_9ASTE|nr:hypothetical protein F0562_034185 [Nyssa sinensis]
MEMKIEIISRETIKPSSPTPHHLRRYELSFLDQLAPPIYAPIVLFYSAPEFNSNTHCITKYDYLKKAVSETLSHFYPLAGRIKHNDCVDYNDDRVTCVEARPNFELSKTVRNPEMNLLQQFLPPDPYDVRANEELMVVQVSFFDCGGIGIGMCISHRIADGSTLGTFLAAWTARSRGTAETIAPSLNSATLFPPRDIHVSQPTGLISKQKSAMNAAKEKTEKRSQLAAITHVVNLRGRMVPPLEEHTNIWPPAVAPVPEWGGEVELHDIVGQLRKTITKIDNIYARQFQGDDGPSLARESLKEVIEMMSKGEVTFYRFSSWVRFPFYEADFGWGNPIWVCISNVPIENVVMLMGTKSGDGIEAWVTLEEHVMAKFEHDRQILLFASSSPSPKILETA